MINLSSALSSKRKETAQVLFNKNCSNSLIHGFSTELEKPYLRLTSAPDPSTVRPERILRKSFDYVLNKYRDPKSGGDYLYACEQFKSIRQDLTVQSINNSFTVSVYETHGRISLETGDLSEYNQCQSRLQELRATGHKIAVDEYGCYRLLYALWTKNRLELISAYRQDFALVASSRDVKEGEARSMPGLEFAFAVVAAVRSGDTLAYFRLYRRAPYNSVYLMDYLLLSERRKTLQRLAKGYLELPCSTVLRQLHFTSRSECIEFLHRTTDDNNDGGISFSIDHSNGATDPIVKFRSQASAKPVSASTETSSARAATKALKRVEGGRAEKRNCNAGSSDHERDSSRDKKRKFSSEKMSRRVVVSGGSSGHINNKKEHKDKKHKDKKHRQKRSQGTDDKPHSILDRLYKPLHV